MAQKNTRSNALNRSLLAAAIATGTVALSSIPAQAAGFSLNYTGNVSQLSFSTALGSSAPIDADAPVSGMLFIGTEDPESEDVKAKEKQSLVDLLKGGFGGIDFSSYVDLVGFADVNTPDGAVNLSFSNNGIDLAGPSFAERIASCETGACTISNTELSINTGTVTFSGRFDDLVATIPAPPTAVPEAGSVLGLIAVAGMMAKRKQH